MTGSCGTVSAEERNTGMGAFRAEEEDASTSTVMKMQKAGGGGGVMMYENHESAFLPERGMR